MDDRQCRLCFEGADTTPFVVPCRCRGTQAYIHTHCLEMYFQYYPDRVCRVCRVQMHPIHSDETRYGLATFLWIFALGHASTLPPDVRAMYLGLVGSVLAYMFALHSMSIGIGILGMALSASFVLVPLSTILWIAATAAVVLPGMLLCMYIPIPFLLIAVAILMCTAYSVAIVFVTLFRADPSLAGMLVPAIFFLWYLVIRARPPHRNL